MDYRDLRAALLRKAGAIEDPDRKHVFYYLPVKDGTSAVLTMLSHGASGQIDSSLLARIARQMRLNAKELSRFVACEITGEEFRDLRAGRPGPNF